MENKATDLVDRIENSAWLAGFHTGRGNLVAAAKFTATRDEHHTALRKILKSIPAPPKLSGEVEENYDGFNQVHSSD